MTFEGKQAKVAKLDAALDKWLTRLIRAANEVTRLRQQRKRLVAPRKLAPHECHATPGRDEVGQPEFADEIPDMVSAAMQKIIPGARLRGVRKL